MTSESTEVRQKIEHLFRHQAGRITSILTGILGSENFDLAEQAVQEAMTKAIEHWAVQGIPHNPEGWLLQVARNHAMDCVRREKFQITGDLDEIERLLENATEASLPTEHTLSGELCDDELKMIFMCCHPAIPREAQVALTLKALCGFEISEIARALLAKDDAIAQRVLRAKQRIKEDKISFVVPVPEEFEERLDSVLEVIYLIFNEGYTAFQGDELVRRDLCEEAIRLARALIENPRCTSPRATALLALMLFQASRSKARAEADGNLVLLKDQDRSIWNQEMIAEGMQLLVKAAHGNAISRFHLEAGIASCHAIAPSEEETDWAQILKYYDQLDTISPSPVVSLNRAVVLAHVKGLEEGLVELLKLSGRPELKNYHLYPAALGDLYMKLGKLSEAVEQYRHAVNLAKNLVEQRFLMKRLSECSQMAFGNLDSSTEK